MVDGIEYGRGNLGEVKLDWVELSVHHCCKMVRIDNKSRGRWVLGKLF